MNQNHATPDPDLIWDPVVDPVLCSPYEPPDLHWELDDLGVAVAKPPLRGRRVPLRPLVPRDSRTIEQPSLFGTRYENPLVLGLREKVGAWREAGYPGATATTRRLLLHWTDPDAMILRPFFAQVEAVETLIWLREIATRSTKERRELEALSREHNDQIVRLCAKMATGTGKTAVMGMVIAWQTLNARRSTRRKNVLFTNRFAVFAPGLTVRRRLSVLRPSDPANVYDEFGLVPRGLRQEINSAKVEVINFQAFTQKELIGDSSARKMLGKKRGDDIESWEAAVRRVLGGLIGGTGICVINDEAHHCYLPPKREKSNNEQKREDHRASVWFNAIRALRDLGALGRVDEKYGQAHPVLDFSATPLWIDSAARTEPRQFEWVASDFGLMDAIESGLVKVPRVPIDDDGARDETVWRNLYKNTHSKNLARYRENRQNLPESLNGALQVVIKDWIRTRETWERSGQPTPPVLILVANSISNAVALYKYLAGWEEEDGTLRKGAIPELSNVAENGQWYKDPRTLVVHSKVADDDKDGIPKELKKLLVATSRDVTQKEAEDAIRLMLNTVGKTGQPGAKVRCVVSVSMLTEGWDARTVTHIVGFRAFSTQLLCEQVMGRALRRTSYDAFSEAEPNDETRARFGDDRRRLEAEYAEVVGIPFEFMPGEPNIGPPPEPRPRTQVCSLPDKREYRVSWPHVLEYSYLAETKDFRLDPERAARTKWTPGQEPSMALVAGMIGETTILEKDARRRSVLVNLAHEMVRIISHPDLDNGLAEARDSGRIALFRSAFPAARQWAALQNLTQNDWDHLAGRMNLLTAAEQVVQACDLGDGSAPSRRARLDRPMISDTAGIDFETTLEHIGEAGKSELSHAACHSRLELVTAQALDEHPQVVRWARNFQLGWTIPYRDDLGWRSYEPDFVAVLEDGVNLIVECKGVYDEKAEAAQWWTQEHWIPCVAGTLGLPDELRRWHYGIISDFRAVQYQLNGLIYEASRVLART
ncbi:MAG: DEAD/DEAH box helicase family protein [bacterium]|nr:DEAD/DEAH box helicase family protein [bacterium]